MLFFIINRLGGFLFFFIKRLIRVNEKKILFVSFGGSAFNDSPRKIYEEIYKNEEYSDFQLIWAFRDKKRILNRKNTHTVKIDSPRYFYHVMSSKIWITNSSVERSFNLKKKNQIYLNTWHGTPLKKMGIDIPRENTSFAVNKPMTADIFLAQTPYEIDIFSRVFQLEKKNFFLTGLPRNDDLQFVDQDMKSMILQKLSLPNTKEIILYAPTFREYNIDSNSYNVTKELDWLSLINDNFIVLVRAHYEVSKLISSKLDNENNIIDVSDYENLNDLIKVSDILVTDYSSIMFDYSITGKPIILYTFDYCEYSKKRGMYFDVRDNFPSYSNASELAFDINNHIFDNRTDEFIKSLEIIHGNGTSKTLDILNKIGHEK